jgi:hypothetical protein
LSGTALCGHASDLDRVNSSLNSIKPCLFPFAHSLVDGPMN